MKCSYIEVNGEGRNVFKDPVTDSGKTSKKGRLALVNDVDEGFITVSEAFAGDTNLLEVVYEDGVIKRRQTFDEIRELAE